jgi:PAS domain S-box-containing protein
MKNETANKISALNRAGFSVMAEEDNISIVKIFTEKCIKIFEADFGFAWGKFRVNDTHSLVYKSHGITFNPVFPFEKKNYQITGRDNPVFFDSDVKKENYKSDISPHLKSYIVLPVRYFDHVYGSIVLGFKKKHNFTKEELALAETAGNIVAQSITINWLVENERKALTLSEKQEAHFRALVENSYEIIVQIDPKGKILYISPSIRKVMGLDPKKFIGKNLVDLSAADKKKQTAFYLKKVLGNPDKRHVEEFTSKLPDGSEMIFESTSAKMSEEGGGGIVINIRDITEHKKLEEAKKAERQLQEEKIKVDSIADATHELRTPLAIIKGNLDLARMGESKKVKPVKNIIDDIDIEVKHLSEIVSDLALISSKPRGGNDILIKEKISISTLVKECVGRCESLAYKKNIKIKVEHIKNLNIKGSRDYLEKMLTNLIKNSINYGRQNGHTKISTSVSKGFVTINVADDGIGIAKGDLSHVFERFYRGDKSHSSLEGEGTGLGLSIVKWIAETHGGSVAVKSTLNKGTTFSVKLPVKAA